MRALERLRWRVRAGASEGVPAESGSVQVNTERGLRHALEENPNDVEAFAGLADRVRRHAAAGHTPRERARAADDAVWALAEELAHSGRAWYPLVEMARLSLIDDRDAALRRLATAADRDPSGRALAYGLHMLREAGCAPDAVNLGVGHWRPREHDLSAARELVEAALEMGRAGEARRHLEALSGHPDTAQVAALRADLGRALARVEAGHEIDLRESSSRSRTFPRV